MSSDDDQQIVHQDHDNDQEVDHEDHDEMSLGNLLTMKATCQREYIHAISTNQARKAKESKERMEGINQVIVDMYGEEATKVGNNKKPNTRTYEFSKLGYVFDPMEDRWQEWIAEHEMKLTSMKVPEADWPGSMIWVTTGSVKKQVMKLIKQNVDWSEMKTQLEETYGLYAGLSKFQKVMMLVTFEEQKNNESLASYAAAFRELVSRAEVEESNLLLQCVFLHKLHPTLAADIIGNDVDKDGLGSFDNILMRGRKSEYNRQQKNAAFNKRNRERDRERDRRTNDDSHKKNRSENNRQQATGTNNNPNNSNNKSNGKKGSTGNTGGNTGGGDKRCFLCDAADHMAWACPLKDMVKQVKSLRDKESSSECPTIPIILNHKYMLIAELDCNASATVVNKSYCEKWDIPIQETKIFIEDYRSDLNSALGQCELTVSCNGMEIQTTALVEPMGETEFILGWPDMQRVGIGLSGVTETNTLTAALQDEVEEHREPEGPKQMELRGVSLIRRENGEHRILQRYIELTDSMKRELSEVIVEAMQRNAELPPSPTVRNRFCTVALDLVEHVPYYGRQYRIPYELQDVVQEQIDKWIHEGVVELGDVTAPYNNPLLVVKKKTPEGQCQKWRVCLDTRMTINRFLRDADGFIPVIDDILEAMKGAKWFSLIDLQSGYHHMVLDPKDRAKTTFTFRGQRYQFARAPFGISSLPKQFQRLMLDVLKDVRDFTRVYLDDVVVFTNGSYKDHVAKVAEVVDTLTEARLRVNRDKCEIGMPEIELLGHVVSGQTIKPDLKKLNAIQHYPTPTTGTDVSSFLGMANFLRRYIPGFAMVAAPLEALRHKKKLDEWWTDEHDTAFDQMKRILASEQVLWQPNPKLPYHVATDSSQFGIGAALWQEVNGEKRYVAFYSKTLNATQSRYPTPKRELYAIVKALQEWRPFLYAKRFHLFTDSRTLTHYKTKKKLSYSLTNWFDQLAEYDFVLHHVKGADNVIADTLSRMLSKEEVLSIRGQMEVDSETMIDDLLLAVDPNDSDELIEQVKGFSTDTPVRNWTKQVERMIQQQSKKRVPTVGEREQLLQQYHLLGHWHADILYQKLWADGYFWPYMLEDCRRTVEECQQCLEHNVKRHGFHPQRVIDAELPMDHVAIDLLVLKTTSRGYNYVLIYVDVLTRFVILTPLRTKTKREVASALWKIWCLMGVPKVVQSDNGSEFKNDYLAELSKHHEVDHRLITPYHPQGNGLAEVHVRSTKQVLKKLANQNRDVWDLLIPVVQYSINTKVHASTKSSPYALLFGRVPNGLMDYTDVVSKPLDITALQKRLQIVADIVWPSVSELSRTTLQQKKKRADKKNKLVGFPVGTKVMLINEEKKDAFDPKYTGPFVIGVAHKGGSYTLIDATGAIHPTRAAPNKLKPLEDIPQRLEVLPEEEAKEQHNAADNVDLLKEKEYEVKEIKADRGVRGKREFLVVFKGYEGEEWWIPENELKAPRLLKAYHDKKAKERKENDDEIVEEEDEIEEDGGKDTSDHESHATTKRSTRRRRVNVFDLLNPLS